MEIDVARPAPRPVEAGPQVSRFAIGLACAGALLLVAGFIFMAVAYAGRETGNMVMATVGAGVLILGACLGVAGLITVAVSYSEVHRARHEEFLGREYASRHPGQAAPSIASAGAEVLPEPKTRLGVVPFAAKNKGATVREFRAGGDVLEIAERWALQSGFALAAQDADSRTYRKGDNPVFVPTFVRIAWRGPDYLLEAWLEPTPVNRFVSLGMIPPALGLDSGGVMASVPRYMGRREVNDLLAALGVATID